MRRPHHTNRIPPRATARVPGARLGVRRADFFVFHPPSFVLRLSSPVFCLSICVLCVICGSYRVRAQDDDLREALKGATTVPAPAPVTGTQPPPIDPFHTAASHLPAAARPGSAVVSNGTKLEGQLWSTAATPLRVWQADDKTYRDIEWSAIKKLEVIVDSATMEKDWRWLKEGSDEKVYSGKSYPLVELRYTITLANDQTITGGVVSPVYVFDGKKVFNLALYKKFKGNLDQTLDDVVYIKSITFTGDAASGRAAPRTTKLPLITD